MHAYDTTGNKYENEMDHSVGSVIHEGLVGILTGKSEEVFNFGMSELAFNYTSKRIFGEIKDENGENIKYKDNNMTAYLCGLLWSIEWRWGFGLDVESVDSRPVWAVVNGEVKAYPFDGLVINLPLLTISIGNVWRENDDGTDDFS